MKASILVVGHPDPQQIEFGADHSRSYDDALETLQQNNYAVVVAADGIPRSKSENLRSSFDFFKELRRLNEEVQTILVSKEVTPQGLQKFINDVGLFKIIPQFDSNILQQAVREALEEYELIKQNQAFLGLTQDQNRKLQALSTTLEERVHAREAFLVEAREKLLQATKATESLNRALVAIHKSVTRQEIEVQLKDALQANLGLTWIRILFQNQTFLEQMDDRHRSDTEIFTAPLFRGKELLGHIYFARDNGRPFQPSEDDFLLQVSDAVALAIDRLRTLNAIESLKQEWDSTFDAITDPVAIVSASYQVIRANKSYAVRSGLSLEKVIGQKCHQVLFGRSKPCAGCHLGESFDLGEVPLKDGSTAHYTVASNPVSDLGHFALFYHDVSDEMRIQRQILESSKMAEIGTIGSSIAHEINNPLGGMIAFLQILKGEMLKTDRHLPDVLEMEVAATKCKMIVENLLAFTRQSNTERQLSKIKDIVNVVCNIMDLQTRALGIQIVKEIGDSDTRIEVNSNQLVQVLVNIVQNSCEAIAERLSQGQRSPPGQIIMRTQLEGNARQEDFSKKLRIEIIDNGLGIPAQDLARVFTPFFTTKDVSKNRGLGLSVSYQIVKEHGGQMEISSMPRQSTTVVLRLQVAKSPTGQQFFD